MLEVEPPEDVVGVELPDEGDAHPLYVRDVADAGRGPAVVNRMDGRNSYVTALTRVTGMNNKAS